MKVALFDDYRPGLVVDERIIDLSGVVGPRITRQPPRDRMPALIANFSSLESEIATFAERPGVPLSAVQLRAPLPRPGKILCSLGNYFEGMRSHSLPFNMFVKSTRSVLDPGGVIRLIAQDPVVFHHEGELAVVIGRPARNVAAAHALEYVFGYTAIIDVSARGFGSAVSFINKSPETFCPMGPWIATNDSVGDPQALRVRLWVDGQLRQDYPTSDMEHGVREIVSWASHVLPLEPGDLLACGVNHQGLGPLQDGERVEIEIDRVGRMEAHVSDPHKRRWPVGIDKATAAAALKFRRGEALPPPSEMFAQRIC